jgi:hypothetical protein
MSTRGRKSKKRDAHALFKSWVAERQLSKAEVARLLGCTPEHVGYLLSRARGPGLRLAFRIEKTTADWAQGPIDAEWWVTAKRKAA